jgi:hypothetical protein
MALSKFPIELTLIISVYIKYLGAFLVAKNYSNYIKLEIIHKISTFSTNTKPGVSMYIICSK